PAWPARAHRRGPRRTAPSPHGHRTHPAAPRIGRSVPRSAPPARSIQWRARPRPVRASRPSVPCLALPHVRRPCLPTAPDRLQRDLAVQVLAADVVETQVPRLTTGRLAPGELLSGGLTL